MGERVDTLVIFCCKVFSIVLKAGGASRIPPKRAANISRTPLSR